MSRNIYLGFVAVLLFLLIPRVTGAYFSEETVNHLAAIFDPLGTKAISFYTKNWTISEQNDLLLPFKTIILYNRFFWLGISGITFLGIYRYFQLHQEPASFTLTKNYDTNNVPKRKNR